LSLERGKECSVIQGEFRGLNVIVERLSQTIECTEFYVVKDRRGNLYKFFRKDLIIGFGKSKKRHMTW
jgi:hypothetical protein